MPYLKGNSNSQKTDIKLSTILSYFDRIRNPEVHSSLSGIDLAVKGIPEEKHLEVEGKLEDIFGDME